jgi:hypothetical protein
MAEMNEIQIGITLDDGTVKRGFARILNDGTSTAEQLGLAFKKSFAGLAALGGVYLSFSKLKAFVSESIDQAAAQEAAVNRVNTALRLAGTFSESASRAFQTMASEIQRTTAIEDDQVLSLSAVARAMTSSNEQAMSLTKAAIELGVATGKGPDEAMQSLNATLSGSVGRLGKVIPELNKFTAEQLKAGAAIDFVNQRFGGSAASELNTFSGRIANLQNVFGDFKEEIGGLITTSPALLAVFKFFSDRLVAAGQAVSKFGSSGDALKPLLLTLIDLSTVINYSVGGALEQLFNVSKIVFEGIRTAAQAVIFTLASAAAKVIGFFSPDSELKKNLDTFVESSGSVLSDFSTNVANASENIFNFNATQNLGQAISDLRSQVESATPAIQSNLEAISGSAAKMADETSRSVAAAYEKIRSSFQQGVLNSITAGVSAIGKTLVTGGNAFQSFSAAVLGVIGDMSIQIGSTLVGIGIGIDALKTSLFTLNGAVAIAAGLALIALGGALKALSGGGISPASSGAATTGPGGGYVATDPEIANPSQEIRDEQSARVTVNIQGDVLDGRESGLRIVELINEAGFANGGRVLA